MADRRYAVLLEVPHSGGAAWRWAAAQFDERLASQVIPPVLPAELIAEVRRGRNGLRLRIAVTVRAADVADAVGAAWQVLEAAAGVGGFDLLSATAEAGPAPLALRPRPRRAPATTQRGPRQGLAFGSDVPAAAADGTVTATRQPTEAPIAA